MSRFFNYPVQNVPSPRSLTRLQNCLAALAAGVTWPQEVGDPWPHMMFHDSIVFDERAACRPRGTAKQRRLTRQRRMQAKRKLDRRIARIMSNVMVSQKVASVLFTADVRIDNWLRDEVRGPVLGYKKHGYKNRTRNE